MLKNSQYEDQFLSNKRNRVNQCKLQMLFKLFASLVLNLIQFLLFNRKGASIITREASLLIWKKWRNIMISKGQIFSKMTQFLRNPELVKKDSIRSLLLRSLELENSKIIKICAEEQSEIQSRTPCFVLSF